MKQRRLARTIRERTTTHWQLARINRSGRRLNPQMGREQTKATRQWAVLVAALVAAATAATASAAGAALWRSRGVPVLRCGMGDAQLVGDGACEARVPLGGPLGLGGDAAGEDATRELTLAAATSHRSAKHAPSTRAPSQVVNTRMSEGRGTRGEG
jgi:hypothetical protein